MNIPFTCTIVNVLRGWSILLVSDSDGGEIIESRGTGRYSNLVGECMKFIELILIGMRQGGFTPLIIFELDFVS